MEYIQSFLWRAWKYQAIMKQYLQFFPVQSPRNLNFINKARLTIRLRNYNENTTFPLKSIQNLIYV